MIRREKADAEGWDSADDDETFEAMLLMLFPPDAERPRRELKPGKE
jgi:hypothetical protein